MRLINTLDLSLREWKANPPQYAILSHRWGDDNQEVSYREFLRGEKKTTTGYRKVLRLCRLARKASIQWAWIDTCCIDKDSSAELSEAINSMFAWYQKSATCFVFFTDADMRIFDETLDGALRNYLPSTATDNHKSFDPQTSPEFRTSWFGRGWTLQELIAPQSITFYHVPNFSREDTEVMLGTKTTLCDRLVRATGIAAEYLLKPRKISNASIARRMSWASGRTTTRIEDLAYSLLGLFNVNMALLYGEGDKAFLRLQESILNSDSIENDETIFAWTSNTMETQRGLLAKSPAEFGRFPCLHPYSASAGLWATRSPVRFSGKGIELQNVLPSMDLKLIRSAILLWKRLRTDRGVERAMVKVRLDCYCTCLGRANGGEGIYLQLNTFWFLGTGSDSAIWSSQWTRYGPQDLLFAHSGSNRATSRSAPVLIRPWLPKTYDKKWRGVPVMETHVDLYDKIALVLRHLRLFGSHYFLVTSAGYEGFYQLIRYFVGLLLAEDRMAYLGLWLTFEFALRDQATPLWIFLVHLAATCYLVVKAWFSFRELACEFLIYQWDKRSDTPSHEFISYIE